MKSGWKDLQDLLIKLKFNHNEVWDFFLIKSEHDYIFADFVCSDDYCIEITHHKKNESESIYLIWDESLMLEKAEKFVRRVYKEPPEQKDIDISLIKSFFWFDGE
jgi:hypothetical protein